MGFNSAFKGLITYTKKYSLTSFGRKLPREIKHAFYLYYKNFFILEVLENVRQTEANAEEYPNVLTIKFTGNNESGNKNIINYIKAQRLAWF